ncbi:hypothetical protein F2Y95_06395 [Aphanizomenon flos-aquae CCAP 1446/1C]|nr:hypothetical protein [Anabaena sp. CCAP 1446/1C]MCM2410026.1 hypothetical protein [Anabaena sp. CCAP 1446/1C]
MKPQHGQGWAYDNRDEMAIPEAQIFRLHWRTRGDEDNAQRPLKYEQIVLVQSARVTHIVELLDDVVYENPEREWSIYRIVKAVWMPPERLLDWSNLPHQEDVFGIKTLPADGLVHDLRTNGMKKFNEYWNNREGLQGFQRHLETIISQIS